MRTWVWAKTSGSIFTDSGDIVEPESSGVSANKSRKGNHKNGKKIYMHDIINNAYDKLVDEQNAKNKENKQDGSGNSEENGDDNSEENGDDNSKGQENSNLKENGEEESNEDGNDKHNKESNDSPNKNKKVGTNNRKSRFSKDEMKDDSISISGDEADPEAEHSGDESANSDHL